MADQPDGRRRRRPGRTILVAIAVLIPAIPVAIGIALSSGQPSAGAATATTAGFTPVGSAAGKLTVRARPHPDVPPGSGAIVAVVHHSTALRATPGGRTLSRLSTKTQFGSSEVLWVVHRVPGWLGVVTPQSGNDRVGWIPRHVASLARVSWQLKVSLGARRLTVLEGGKVIRRFTVAIGRPDAPTPTGRFAVTDRLRTGDPGGPYGCCILALSANSPHAIQGWTGGNRIAIHSTPDAASIGEAASHGCVRVTLAEGSWLLSHVPLGTPTLIST